MSKNKKVWFYDSGEVVWADIPKKTVYMPFDRDPETYGPEVKGLIKQGYVVQLEIV